MTAQRVFSFVGAKGGCGASTLCIEVAREMRRHGRVGLIDGGLVGRRSIAVMLNAVPKFDSLRARSLTPITPCDGLRVVELAESLTTSFSLRAETVARIAGSLDDVDSIVVDAPEPYAGALYPLISRTLRFLIVTEPTRLGAAGARAIELDHLRSVPRGRIAVVVQSRSPGYEDVKRSELERILDVPIFAEIPSRADPLYAQSIATLADDLAGVA
jgi:Flp pilus assembly CpaE family ATPase